MVDEDTEKSLRRLRGEVRRLGNEADRARVRSAVWPVLTMAALMLFWPTFDLVGAASWTGSTQR